MRASCRCLRAWSPGRRSSARSPAAARRVDREHGSPLNVHRSRAAGAQRRASCRTSRTTSGVDFRIFFARKANKALALVDEARRHRARRRRRQRARAAAGARSRRSGRRRRRDRGRQAARAARALRRRGRDGRDRQRGRAAAAARGGRPAANPVAGRAAARARHCGGRPHTRFGLAPLEMLALLDRYWPAGGVTPLTIAGVHFHLDGYAAADRVTALTEGIELVEALRERGHDPAFIDMGGGIPDELSRRRAAAWDGSGASTAPACSAARAADVRRPRPRPGRPRGRDRRPPERLSVLPALDARRLAGPRPRDRGDHGHGRARRSPRPSARAASSCAASPGARSWTAAG